MTAIQRVRRAQRILGAGAILNALAWGIAAALTALAIAAFAALLMPDLRKISRWEAGAAIAIGVVVAGVLIWRARHLVSISRVALWIEERIPQLHYSLVTAVENGSPSQFSAGMESAIDRHNVGGATIDALRRRLLPAFGAAAAAGLLLYVSPSAAFGGGHLFPRLSAAGAGASGPAGSRLERIEARITPPGYAGLRPSTLDDPSAIQALTGSRIQIRGEGQSIGVTASVGGSSIRVADASGDWSVSIVMPSKPAAVTLRDRQYERLVVLDPRADNPPRIVLSAPARDTTLRAAQLVVRLEANATDDVGLNGAYFEYLITTGSGEIFSARTVTTPIVGFSGARNGVLSASLDLASLKLGQGDVVSIRAIAQDNNTLSGPGLATSDTRTFRIARADEYDSVAVDAAAPLPVDSSAMSQRMLIMMTEKLVREQKGLTRAELVKRSTEIGDLEDRVRKRVHDILYEIEGGEEEEAPGAAAPGLEEEAHSDDVRTVRNPDLLEAYNALWEAVRSLQIAEPAPALPPMRVALKALDRARLANRMYLRGLPPRVIVDLARVRMTGKEKGSANVRTPLPFADSAHARLERQFSGAIELIQRQPADAIRAFTLLQVEALSTSPRFASEVGAAIDAFRRGRDATLPLIRARRALAGEPAAAPGLPAWSGGW